MCLLALCDEYAGVAKELEVLESKSSSSSEKVSSLTSDLAELGVRLEELKESFESKDGGTGGAADTSPAVRIKAALQQLKAEVLAMDLRIGVVSHSVLAARVSSTNRRRVVSAKSGRRRNTRRSADATDGGMSDYEEGD
jgi:Intra-flagellar transport protein 57